MSLKTNIDDGFVEVVDVLGTDVNVVNAARVSFGKRIEEMGESDVKLLNYLARNGHTSPFRHASVTFHIKMPEFVARQMIKHQVGAEFSFITNVNEISGRYVQYEPTFWSPKQLRKSVPNVKQGSSADSIDNESYYIQMYENATKAMYEVYESLIKAGVCKEQARTILPLNFYTEFYWTASLQAIQHFVKLRTESHAQREIRDYANVIKDMMGKLYPNAWSALTNSVGNE